MRLIPIFLLCLPLTACVTANPVALPSGGNGYAISCPGAARSIADCMNKAAELCHGPYSVVNENAETVGAAIMPVGRAAMGMAGIHRTLIVECH